MSPLKRDWVNLYTPMVEMLGLQVRMNVKRRAVEIKVGDVSDVQNGTAAAGPTLQVKDHRKRITAPLIIWNQLCSHVT